MADSRPGMLRHPRSEELVEIFVDFGLFELVVALGLSAASRAIFSHRRAGVAFLVVACAAPIALVVIESHERARWVAAVALATALVNVATIATLMRRYDLGALLTARPSAAGRAVATNEASRASEREVAASSERPR